MNQKTLVGLHIPKCAGTTLLDRVRDCLPGEMIYQNTSIINNLNNNRDEFLNLTDRNKLRFVFGHFIHEEMLKLLGHENIFLFTGLRDPVERVISQYKFELKMCGIQGRKAPNITDFLKGYGNYMCNFLITRFPSFCGNATSIEQKAINILQQFNLVYFSESFEYTTKPVYNLLAIKQNPEINSNLSETEIKHKIDINEEYLKYDISLYKQARELFFNKSNDEMSFLVKKTIESEVNMDVVRNFLYNAMFHEYHNWGRLDDVINQKLSRIEKLSSEHADKCDSTDQLHNYMAQINEISNELKYYLTNLNKK